MVFCYAMQYAIITSVKYTHAPNVAYTSDGTPATRPAVTAKGNPTRHIIIITAAGGKASA